MKPSMRLFGILFPLFALSLFASGCYTQLATTRDEDEGTYSSKYDEPRAGEQEDTTVVHRESYYDNDDQWYGHSRIGFGYYYPSSWYWDFTFGDPYYGGMYGYPGYHGALGYRNPYYGYGYGYYGYDPYRYYSGYPYVVYGQSFVFNRTDQTRDAGYRRTSFARYGGGTRATAGSVGASLGVTPASRRSSSQGSRVATPTTRRSDSPSGRTERSYTPRSSSSGRSAAAPSRSGAPSVRSTPSGGSRSPEGSQRSSGSTRSRGYSDAPASGYYRVDAGSQRSSTPSYSPRSSSSPTYAPSPSYTPAPSSAPASSSPAPSSGGGDGGNRSSGATRSGRN